MKKYCYSLAYRSVDRTRGALLNIGFSGDVTIHVDLPTFSDTTLFMTVRVTRVEKEKLGGGGGGGLLLIKFLIYKPTPLLYKVNDQIW